MTIVCWDGVSLAADRQRTKRDAAGERRVISLEATKILHLKGSKARFASEPIYALGRAGNVGVTKRLIEAVSHGKDLAKPSDALQKRLRDYVGSKESRGSLLLLSETHTFVVRFSTARGIHHRVFDRRTPVAIGQGSLTATWMLVALRLPAELAVYGMHLYTPAVGGGVLVAKGTKLRSVDWDQPFSFTTISPQAIAAKAFRLNVFQHLEQCLE